ncbi:MAG: tetratricopeptide repeat protein [Verrucomicrobia bacterium]|nr:tetratricopeptide repeat protein [Verrucomicrobiota bacterium]MCH8511425.1 tetratricopeptide repeat protein [Kiritimatiellia bacterium]
MNIFRQPPNRIILICCLTAALLRLLYLLEQSQTSVLFFQPTLDEQEMVLTAQALLRGEGFGEEPLFKAPLYPVMVAASQVFFGEGWFWGLRVLQHLGGVLVVAMGVDVAGRLVGDDKSRRDLAGLITGMTLALYAPLIRLENRLVLDFTVALFQSAMVWAGVRWLTMKDHESHGNRLLIATGCFGALAWLTRPTITPVLPLFGLLMVFLKPADVEKRRLRRTVAAALFFLPTALAMTTVVARNAIVGREAMLLPWQGGYNLYQANRSGASGRYFVQDTFADSSTGNPTSDLMLQGYRQAVADGERPAVADEKLYAAVNDFWTERLLAEIREHPGEWLALMVRKGVYLVSAREIFNFEDFGLHKKDSMILRWLPLSFGWLWPLALASLALPVCMDPAARRVRWLLWGYLLLMGGAIALVFVSGRLRMPLAFPAAVLAGGGVSGAMELFRRRSAWRWRTMAPPLALFGLGLIMSWGDWWGVRSEQVAHHDLARLSGAAWRAGRYDLALDYALQAENLAPDYPRLPILKAQALFSLERTDEAEVLYLRAMEEQPRDAAPAFNLGMIAYDAHEDPERALHFFQAALRRQPAHTRALAFQALCFLQLGDLDAAAQSIQALQQMEAEPSFLTRVAVMALLRTANHDRAAQDYYDRWLAPLDENVLRELEHEVEKVLRRTKTRRE